MCNSEALEYENLQNPNPRRRTRTAALLTAFGAPTAASAAVFQRAGEIRAEGFRDLDALHIAFAEALTADYLVTTDDALLRRSRDVSLAIEVVDPVSLMRTLNL